MTQDLCMSQKIGLTLPRERTADWIEPTSAQDGIWAMKHAAQVMSGFGKSGCHLKWVWTVNNIVIMFQYTIPSSPFKLRAHLTAERVSPSFVLPSGIGLPGTWMLMDRQLFGFRGPYRVRLRGHRRSWIRLLYVRWPLLLEDCSNH